jgi:predicted RNA binding protein YcfA (HicA-like mRNA interferase family)
MAKDSRDLIRELEADGWRYIGATGSHHHYKHSAKPGKVTVPHPTGLASENCPLNPIGRRD